MDETYVKVRGQWAYLYRAVDKHGDTIDFHLSPTRNTAAAKRFLGKALRGLKEWEQRECQEFRVAGHSGSGGMIPWPVAKSLQFRMRCWTSAGRRRSQNGVQSPRPA